MTILITKDGDKTYRTRSVVGEAETSELQKVLGGRSPDTKLVMSGLMDLKANMISMCEAAAVLDSDFFDKFEDEIDVILDKVNGLPNMIPVMFTIMNTIRLGLKLPALVADEYCFDNDR